VYACDKKTIIKFMKNKIFLNVLVVFFLLSAPKRVYAYLDPGTGNYILQITIASLLGVGIMVRSYWGKIKSFFDKIFKK